MGESSGPSPGPGMGPDRPVSSPGEDTQVVRSPESSGQLPAGESDSSAGINKIFFRNIESLVYNLFARLICSV